MKLEEFAKLVHDLEEGITRSGAPSRLKGSPQQKRSAQSMLREIMARDRGKEELDAALRALDMLALPSQPLAERPPAKGAWHKVPLAAAPVTTRFEDVQTKIAALFSPKAAESTTEKAPSAASSLKPPAEAWDRSQAQGLNMFEA